MHTAPGHGEDDYDTGVRHGLEIYSPVLANGRFDDTVPEFIRGKTVWEGNPLIIEEAQGRGVLFAEVKIRHSYPHDWRSKTPIIFRATEQWFVAMDKPFARRRGRAASLRDRAWTRRDGSRRSSRMGPQPHGRDARVRPDWCVSPQRAWGLPIPVFYNDKGEPLLTPESVRAVAKRFDEHGADAWFTDSPTNCWARTSATRRGFGRTTCGRRRTSSTSGSNRAARGARCCSAAAGPELSGGSVPGRLGPASRLVPVLAAAGTGRNGQPPFKAVLTHGFVVKPDGTKVSKSDKEYVTATQEIDRHGADLLRLWGAASITRTTSPPGRR